MQKQLFAAALAAVIGIGGSALAADIYSGGGMKDGPVYVPVNTWSGFYFGANGGYGWDAGGSKNLDVNVLGTTFTAGRTAEPEGGFGGTQIGYNWQRDRIVFGIETDIQISDINGNKTTSTPIIGPLSFVQTDKTEMDWFGTLRGRLGFVWEGSLLYATGGLAYGKVNEVGVGSLALAGVGSLELGRVAKSDIQTGYVIGGGIEFKPSWGLLFTGPNWTMKLEYQYINLGSERMTGSALLGLLPVTTNAHDDEFHTIRFGVNYHVPGYEPLK